MKHIIFIIFISIACAFSSIAQNDTIPKTNQSPKKEKTAKRFKKVYWGLKAGGGQMLWDNDLSAYTSTESTPMNGGFFIEFRPIKYIGIETGASYFIMKSTSALDSYSNTITAMDDEGDQVEHRFTATGLNEEQELTLVNIPIALKLNAFAGNWEFFAKGGMVYRYSLSATYNQSGQFSNHGYYNEWGLLVEDLPNHGYYSSKFRDESGDITWKDGLEPFIGGGIVFPGRGTSFFIEGMYYLGNTDFVEKQEIPFSGRMNNSDISNQVTGSIMEMGTTKLSGFVINIGLRF